MISVIIPLYNGAKFIQRSINSVLNQTYQNFEIVVVNDGSTDHGPQIVAQWQHSSIKLISQKNSGVSIARNTGIKAAKGNIIAFLDADDEWLPNHLEVIHHLVERYPECGVFGTSYFFKRENESLTLPVYPISFLLREQKEYSIIIMNSHLVQTFLCKQVHMPYEKKSYKNRRIPFRNSFRRRYYYACSLTGCL